MPEPMDANDVSPRSTGDSRVIRSPKTFERSPTTFARSREGLGHHPLDRILAFLRLRFGSEFLFSSAHLFFLCGKYGLLVGAVLLFFQSMQKLGAHVLTLLVGLGLILLILVCHYVVTRFLFVLERWDRRINGCLSSSVVPDALSLLALVGSSVFLVLGTINAISTGSLEFVFWGVAVFIWGLFAALQSLNLEGMNLQVNPEIPPADEILGLIQFALKMLVRLTPVLFGVMVLVANLQLIVEIAIDGSETTSEVSAAIAKTPPLLPGDTIAASPFVEEPPPFQNLHGIHTLFLAGTLPGIIYLAYVLGHFVSAVFSVFLAAVPERGTSVASYPAKNDLTDA
jgi:hypothetical protein